MVKKTPADNYETLQKQFLLLHTYTFIFDFDYEDLVFEGNFGYSWPRVKNKLVKIITVK